MLINHGWFANLKLVCPAFQTLARVTLMQGKPLPVNRNPVAIDYSRWSKPEQSQGDSARRQAGLADAWSARTGIPIDLRLNDDGVSGRNKKRRADADKYDLALFLELVNKGTVRRGDYLLLENLDRLSREEEVPATHLLTSILVAGVRIVQLAPCEMELTDKSDMFTIFRAVMELSRGHGESERKHQMVSGSYANNRQAAARGEETYQGQLPAWIRREGSGKGARHRKLVLIAERAATVRRIFLFAAEGLGYRLIVRKLVSEGVRPFVGRIARTDAFDGQQQKTRTGQPRWIRGGADESGGQWTRGYVLKILRGRAAMGELRTRTGELLPIPAAVTEDEWLAAQAGRTERDKHRGRSRENGQVGLFSKMLTDAQTGEPFFSVIRYGAGRQWRVIANAAGHTSNGSVNSFPEPAFEGGILRCILEIRPKDLDGTGGGSAVSIIDGRLAEVRSQLAGLAAELAACAKPPRGAIQVMTTLEAEETALEDERRKAAFSESHPVAESWEQAHGLIEAAQDPVKRLRLRSALRRIIESVHVLIVPRGWDKVAAVQMRFTGSADVRSFLIAFRKDVLPSGLRASRRKGEHGEDLCTARSILDRPALDLRDRSHVAELRSELERLDLATV